MKGIWCNGFPEIYAQLEERDGVNLPWVYVHCAIYVTGTEIGLRKRWRGLDAVILIGVLAWKPADAQMNNGASDVHAQ